jgi:hypothetical protein
MVLADVVTGNRVQYNDNGVILPGTVMGTNNGQAVVMFDRDQPTELTSEVAPSKLTALQDGGYQGGISPSWGAQVSVTSAAT